MEQGAVLLASVGLLAAFSNRFSSECGDEPRTAPPEEQAPPARTPGCSDRTKTRDKNGYSTTSRKSKSIWLQDVDVLVKQESRVELEGSARTVKPRYVIR